MHVKVRQLLALDAIVRVGSFVEAARVLHVTPAALSLTIRKLEDDLGFSVLERTTRSVRLSEAGRGYLPFAQRILHNLEEAERYAREVQQGHGVLRIATTQTIIATLVSAALPEIHARWPKVRIHPLDVATTDIRDAIASGRADLAIGVNFESNEQHEARTFFTSSWYAYAGSGHPLGSRERIAWRDLRGQRLFMNKSSHMHLQLALDDRTLFDDVHDVGTAISGLAVASGGTGMGVYPGYVRPFATVLGVRRLPLDSPHIPHELQIVSAHQPSTSLPLHEIRDLFVQAVQKNCGDLR